MKVISNTRNPNWKRLNEIVRVLRRNGLQFVSENGGLSRRNPLRPGKSKEEEKLEDNTQLFAVRVRKSFQELGPTFIKLGQTLSTRPDLVGHTMANELTKLQDNNPPIPFEEIKVHLENELGKPITEVYSEFDEEPLATASIGQVHHAILKKEEKEVAVKIQKPGLEKIIEVDLNLMRFFAKRVNKYVYKARTLNLPDIEKEFERSLYKEIDYNQELSNMQRFKENFKDNYKIYIPKAYTEYSNKHILTMEFVKGEKVSYVMEHPEGYDTKLIADVTVKSYFQQILIDGFFHADPHPANIYILNSNIVCFLDEGMMGYMDATFRENLAELFLFFISRDVDNMINQLRYMDILNEETDLKALKYDLNDMISKYYGAELHKMKGGMADLMDVMIDYNVTLPREFVLMARGVGMMEDTGQKLDPDFNVVKVLSPLAERLLWDKFSPRRGLDYVKHNAIEVEHLMKILPRFATSMLYKVEEGKIEIEVGTKGIDKATDKISIAIIIAALLVGSSLVMLTNRGIMLLGFPFLGIIGFTLSLGVSILSIYRFFIKKDNKKK
ncbi:MAG: AarF/ABC1/UbiB kinase family protein [Methanobacteriaceae archaeon]|nr:AarF/ABC1/UbiB kinase family protein [Methanobacteriaceae archaeon]